MLNYLDFMSAMQVRTLTCTPQEYFFVAQVVLGENPTVAYALAFDTANMKRMMGTEDEGEYFNSLHHDAEVVLSSQSCTHLRSMIEEEYQSEVQAKASTLEDYKFTGADVQKLLNNLLHERTQELSESSVRDILALIKSMYDSGALDSGENWSKHFISIPRKFDCICSRCNHEMYAIDGLDLKCPHCKQVYKYSEEERRFYPKLSKL